MKHIVSSGVELSSHMLVMSFCREYFTSYEANVAMSFLTLKIGNSDVIVASGLKS